MASPNLSEIVTTTLRNRSGKLADNVTKNNALLNRLNKRGNVKPVDGGRTIVQELEYAENSTYKRYSGYETLNIQPSDVFTAAEFDWKQAAVAVSISGLEQLQNSGKEKVIDLLESRIKNAERTMQNNLSADCYSDGTADGGKQIGGLQLLVADSPSTGTVGGINRATWSFFRNVSYDATTDGGAAATSANIQSYMNRVWLQLVRGTDRPDLIIADNNYFRLYWESLQAIQRITSDDMAQAGFSSLKFMDADVVFDGGYGGAAPSNHMYFLNTNYIYLRPHKDRNMVPLDPDRFSVNQDAMVKLTAWAGNMTLSNAFLQGVLKD
ncbi:phage major capsid protein [Massilia endophytica]|uniref:phage major capsid protein n=1 Tax=Massilia endophytica TaxID=2899220 RepID=UPI001E2E95E2|nr:phage major capsid protein [Massilia endophytica]UGQ44968.1 phage major capsid protein [Massilia endophytica]